MDNNKVIHKLKDNSYKELFDNPEVFIQFIKHFSNVPLLNNIKAEDIEDYTNRYVPLFLEEKDADSIKVVKIKEDIFVITMIEHQSEICYNMSCRMLWYMVLIWNEWIKQKEKEDKGSTIRKDFKLPPILPIVYYTGTDTWSAEINFSNSVYLCKEFYKYIPNFNYELVPLNKYTIEDLMKYEDILSFIMILDKIKKPTQIKEILEKITEEYINKVNENIPDNLLQLIKDIVFLFLKKIDTPKKEREKIENLINERRFSTMFETLEYNAQKEREQYKAEGRLEGKLEGKKESKVEIAKNMLINNLSITIISDCTGLSKEEIEKLK